MKNVLTVNGSRKFATMPSKKINRALKLALNKGLIDEIPNSQEERLESFREIAVVANNSRGYTFLEENISA